MANFNSNNLKILYINTYGQTKFTSDKQLQLQDMIRHYKCDIIHLQETDCDDDTFANCNFIQNNFNIISNNCCTKYGTASLVRNDFDIQNIGFDNSGKTIIFDVNLTTFVNVYLQAGTDSPSRASRENYCSEVLPNLLINCGQSGFIGGDWNCIVNKIDATHHPDAKMSPSLARMIKTFGWKDSYRISNLNRQVFSHYFKSGQQVGATRIDREYHWGAVNIVSSEYVPVAFSDHLGYLVESNIPNFDAPQRVPRGMPYLKISDEVAKDDLFKSQVSEAMGTWQIIKNNGLNVLTWWELVVKPGLRHLALNRSKVMKKEQRGKLNLLLIRQAHLVKKLKTQPSTLSTLIDFQYVKTLIQDWYSEQNKKIQIQSRKKEFQGSERTRIYHHELHKSKVQKNSILRLETDEGIIEGHDECSAFLEKTVRNLLGSPAILDQSAQDTLLDEIDTVFTDSDNEMLSKPPTKNEIHSNLLNSNLHASAGSDGIPGMVYKECWDTLGDSLLEVHHDLLSGQPPTTSMATALMIFSSKPKKMSSIKPSDKRRISILNCDYKLYESLLARRFRKIGSRTLSPLQYVAGSNRTIQHGIARARYAITAAGRLGLRCGIGDQDFMAAFDFLVLSWVWKVLKRKGVNSVTLSRLESLYSGGITIPVVNNIPGRAVRDRRGSLRQGGVGSMEWFAVGIDPLLIYLDRRLVGIPVCSLPVLGPVEEGLEAPMPVMEERFKLMAFCNDVKPAITSLEEFVLADQGASLFEKAAGTRLHRDPRSNKCKFLPLGKWRGELKQEDIPTPYMILTDTLDMVGVQLSATWRQSRKKNGDNLKEKISLITGSWRTGKFMPLTSRPFSINTYALSKV